MNPKGQIQTVANQRRVGIQKQEEQSNGGTVLRQGLGSYSRSIHNNVFEFYKTGAPTQVKNGNFSLSTIPGVPLCCLTTNQSEESHTPYSPHPKCCLLFLGPSDDHLFRPPLWPCLFLLCFCISSFPWLAIVWIHPLELREDQGGWMKPISYRQKMENTE